MYQQIELEAAIQSLKKRQGTPPRNAIRFTIDMMRVIARGDPVSVEMLADATDVSLETAQNAFNQLRGSSAEFDNDGHLRGTTVTQIPTPHQFHVNGQPLYAWCALDTLFLPAYLDATADITSACPVTGTPIQLVVNPDGIQSCSPPDVAVSIVIPELAGDSCNTRAGFCGQIYFFESQAVALKWAEHRPEIAIFLLADAYQIAQEVYIKPVMEQLN